ncbi:MULTISPECIES: GspH/FimT family protein [Thermus]|uniref:GspH/FimT family protein n=1 Tax=Thermus TaxID=270 RepID=UPI001F20C739|nr:MULTISPECIES: GspH/FimT family protein [Thermus]
MKNFSSIKCRGLTLLELLVVLALLGLLLGLGGAWWFREREGLLLAELRSFLERGRTEAIRRGEMVAVVAEGDGLLACLDLDRNGTCQGNPLLARFRPGLGARVELHTGFQPGLRFNALGRPHTGVRVALWMGSQRVLLCVSIGGRVRETPNASC